MKKFVNFSKFLYYINKHTIYDIENKIPNDFSIDDFVQELDYICIDNELILSIREKLMYSTIEDRFWSEVLPFLYNNSYCDELIEYLINNNLALTALAHLNLKDEHLIKLFDIADEAILTYGKRIYSSELYSIDEFDEFLRKFTTTYWLWSSLLKTPLVSNEKYKVLIKNLFSITSFADLKEQYLKDNIYRVLTYTNKLNLIEKYYQNGDNYYLKAISQNINTPINILGNLLNLSYGKYSKQIRNNAKETLKSLSK